MLIALWSTRNIKFLFPPNGKVAHQSPVIYEGQCSCILSYVGETKRHTKVRWKEHEDPAGKSESVKHLIQTLLPNLLEKYCWLHLHTPVERKFRKHSFLH